LPLRVTSFSGLPIFDCPLFIVMNLIQTFTYFLIENFWNYLIWFYYFPFIL
jgi:hypothetical protein